MGTSSINRINRLIDYLLKSELEISLNRNLIFLLIYLDRHKCISLKDLENKLKSKRISIRVCLDSLLSEGFINKDTKEKYYISEKGRLLLNPIYYSRYNLREIEKNGIPGYRIETEIGEGSTSLTYKAVKEKTGRIVVLKILKPGLFDSIDIPQKIKEVSSLGDEYLVVPIDYGSFHLNEIEVKFVEMEYVEGLTLSNFLEGRIRYDKRAFVAHFIQEVGGVLCKIESKGLQHSDLHSNNIMVIEDTIHKGTYHFKIIDFAGLTSKEQSKEYEYSDLDYFRKNLINIVNYTSIASRESVPKALGEKLYHIYNKVLQKEYKSFSDIVADLSKDYVRTVKKVDIEKPFHIFVFEQYDISDPKWLRIFEPDPVHYERLKSFNNVIVSGPRGCGKTIYLKSLSFVPDLTYKLEHDDDLSEVASNYPNYRQIFGIFFACRQAEFKLFANKYVQFTPKTELFIKHIFVLKIIRRTFSLIGRAYTKGLFEGMFSSENVMTFISKYLGKSFGFMGTENQYSELSEILENEEADCLNLLGQEKKYPTLGKLLNENKLIEFFDIINKSVSELKETKFYIIFDDVSDPNMSFEAQRILNSIARTTNSKYCFKISTEKYGYDFSDMDGKMLQSPHDFDYIDLSTFGKEETDKYGKRLKDYLERVINRQLVTAGYPKEKSIKDYLAKLPYTHDTLINHLAEISKRVKVKGDLVGTPSDDQTVSDLYKKVKYGGWEIICQLSSGSVRVVLQICDAIFKEHRDIYSEEKLKKDPSAKINIDIQNRAIFKFSREEYTNLINIKDVGKHLFDIVRNFGRLSRDYLTRDITLERGRKDERIAIERRDNKALNSEAEIILRLLLRHSIFTDTGLSFSRNQIGLVQKFILHRKYCPALRITYREREHFRLSADEMELLLLKPERFFQTLKSRDEKQLDLFKNG